MRILLKTRRFEVGRRRVEGRDGRPALHDIILHPGAVVVLPLLSDDELIMIRQYRSSLDRALWELPAGTLDVPGEPPESAALRELEEETGYRADRIEPLCAFYTSPGVMNERIQAFVATGLTPTRQRLEATEHIVVRPMPLGEVEAMVRDGRIEDAKTLVTLMRWTMDRKPVK